MQRRTFTTTGKTITRTFLNIYEQAFSEGYICAMSGGDVSENPHNPHEDKELALNWLEGFYHRAERWPEAKSENILRKAE